MLYNNKIFINNCALKFQGGADIMSKFARSKRTGSVKVIVIAGIAVVVLLGAFSSAYLYSKHKNEGKQLTAMKQAEKHDNVDMKQDDKLSESKTPVMNPVDESTKDSTTADTKQEETSNDNKATDEKESSDSANTNTNSNSVEASSTDSKGSSSTSHKKVTNINDRQAIASKESHQSHSSNKVTHTSKPQPVEHGSNSISYQYGETSLPNYNKNYVISNSASNTTTSESNSSTGTASNSSKPSGSDSTTLDKVEVPQDNDTQNDKAIFCASEVNDFWKQLNAYRESKGLKPLEWNSSIAKVAGAHAEKGALDGYIKHNKDYPGQALLRTNLYSRPMTGEQLITPLRNSSLHSRILLNDKATEGAVSIYRQPDYTYFVVVDMNA